MALREFGNDGGPLLILPQEAAPYWEGGDPPSDGRVVKAVFRWNGEPATDYDRACDSDKWAEVLQVGPSWGVILGSDDSSDAWLGSGEPDSATLVRVLVGDEFTDEEVPVLFAAQPEQNWKCVASDLSVVQGVLLLLHGASRGNEVTIKPESLRAVIGDALAVSVSPGRYTLDLCEVEMPDTHYVFLRFQRQ